MVILIEYIVGEKVGLGRKQKTFRILTGISRSRIEQIRTTVTQHTAPLHFSKLQLHSLSKPKVLFGPGVILFRYSHKVTYDLLLLLSLRRYFILHIILRFHESLTFGFAMDVFVIDASPNCNFPCDR